MELSRALESAVGIDYEPRTGAVVRLERPMGFIVAERRIRSAPRGDRLLYWVRKTGLSTNRLAALIGAATGGRAVYAGLKDADAVAYQYILVQGARIAPQRIEGEGFTAWLVGWRDKGLRFGSHLWNNFRLEARVLQGDPGEVCEALGEGMVPGFYGPQRFGEVRPDTHVLGLFKGLHAPGPLALEFSYTYPLQPPYRGGYEERGLEAARKSRDPYILLSYTPSSLARDALQSYVWNRMLSLSLPHEGPPTIYARVSRAVCPVERRAWLAPLPSRRLLESGSEWGRLLEKVIKEERLPPRLLPRRAPLRPVAVEACRLQCRARGDGVTVWVTLPRGIYATMAVRAVAYVEWVN